MGWSEPGKTETGRDRGTVLRTIKNGLPGRTVLHPTYDVFGVPLSTAKNNIPNPFTGYQSDSISGLNYAQARYYNPAIGRFTAEDTVRDGLNWYQSFNANPLRFKDKNGLWCCCVHRDMTREWAIEMGFCEQLAAEIGRAAYAPDSISSGNSFLPDPAGKQGIHFNRFDPGDPRGNDSREYYSNLYLDRAVAAWNRAHSHYYAIYQEAYYWMRRETIMPNIRELVDARAQFNRERQRALDFLGISLHAIQDIPAHGHIDAGSSGWLGHGDATVHNHARLIFPGLMVPVHLAAEGLLRLLGFNPSSGNDLIIPFPYVPSLPNPDSLNYEWADNAMIWLVRALDPNNNARILRTRDYTRDVLDRFAYRTTMVLNPVQTLHRPTCGDDNRNEGGNRGTGGGGGGSNHEQAQQLQ